MTVTELETKSVLVAINSVFPNRFKLEQDTIAAMIRVWHTLLEDLPEGAALAACKSVLAQAKHPPNPSEIRALALEENLEAPTGTEAWGEVCKAIGRVGMYRTPTWSSPAIEISVEAIGGWQSICTSNNTAADRARFIDHLDSLICAAKQRVLSGASTSIASALSKRTQIKGMSPVAGLIGQIANEDGEDSDD